MIVPRGSYFDRDYFMSYSSNRSAFLATTLSLRTGTFWKGDKTTFNGSVFLINAPHLNTSFNYSYNRIRLPAADFDTHLGGLKIDYSFGPQAFLNIFVQYNSDATRWSQCGRAIVAIVLPKADHAVNGVNRPEQLEQTGQAITEFIP